MSDKKKKKKRKFQADMPALSNLRLEPADETDAPKNPAKKLVISQELVKRVINGIKQS